MKLKKLFVILLSAALVFSLGACAKTAQEPDTKIRIAGLKGPTSMGLVKLMDNEKYEFTLAGSADEVTPLLLKGELDMAAVPANLAAVLYNNSDGKIVTLAVNTLGVLSLLEKGDTVNGIEDLKGKTVYATGKGSTPEYTLRHILQSAGIDPDKDVTIEFKSEPAEVVALLQNENGIAMLPQPYATAALSQTEGLRLVLDISDAWDALVPESRLITGVLAARKDFVEKYPEATAKFLAEYRDSADWVNANNEEASQLIEKYGITKAAIAKKALPHCSIVFMDGAEMKQALSGYLAILSNQNPKAVGGKLPGEDFYYAAPSAK